MTGARFWVTWLILGCVLGTALVGLVGFGIVIAVAVAIPMIILGALRVPGMWMGLAGVGLGFAGAWTSLVVDPNAPDDELWPIALGLGVAVLGVLMFRRAEAGRR